MLYEVITLQLNATTGKPLNILGEPYANSVSELKARYGERVGTRTAGSRWQGSEAPEVIYKDGYYYLFMAYDGLDVVITSYSIHYTKLYETLIFSFVGMEMQEIAATGGTLNVIMKEQSIGLEEVVAIGYGTQRKVDLTGSVAIVDAEDMKKVSNSNISTMLEGKVAGVQITSDGQPGADPTVRIRGIGSFGSTSPLYVVDGVPMGTTIRDFSPNDIETLQVLKDASAAAIYGSRAANGVVIITTKQGKKNQAMKIDYSGYVGVDQVQDGVYDVMDATQYAEYA